MAVSPSNIGIKTTNAQYQNLINILSDRQDIAHGITRRSKDELGTFWVYVSNELNRLGPPTKDPIAWRKVWSDYKSYVKKKLVQNKKEIEITDGKPRKLHFLNSLEQKVVRISGLEKYIKLVDGKVLISFEEGRLGPANADTVNDIMNIDIPSPSKLELKKSSTRYFKNKNSYIKEELDFLNKEGSIEKYMRYPSESSFDERQDNEIENALILTKKNILRQNDSLKEIKHWPNRSELNNKKLNHVLRKLYKGLYHLYIVQKSMLRETIRHNQEVERILKRRVKIKEQILEIKRSQIQTLRNVEC